MKGQAPVDDSVLAVTLVTENAIGDGGGAELTVVTADSVTVPAELVALMVYTVDVAGDTTLVPATSTCPIPWSILTDVAPVTFHNKVDVPPELIADGLLLKATITGGVTCGGGGGGAIAQPALRTSNDNGSKRKPNLFNLFTSKKCGSQLRH